MVYSRSLSTGISRSLATVAAGADGPWTPADEPSSVAAWYDADDATTITESAGSVSQWDDKGGGNFHLKQGTPSNQPTTGGDLNGYNTIQFPTSNNRKMQTDTNPYGATITDAMLMMVYKTTSTNVQGTFSLSGADSPNRFHAYVPYTSKVYFDYSDSTTNNRRTYTHGWSVGDIKIMSFYGSSTDSIKHIYENGELKADSSSANVSLTTGGGFSLGIPYGVTLNPQGDFGEIILLTGTVSDALRQKCEGYLAHKWGQEGQLPSDHPYKSSAP